MSIRGQTIAANTTHKWIMILFGWQLARASSTIQTKRQIECIFVLMGLFARCSAEPLSQGYCYYCRAASSVELPAPPPWLINCQLQSDDESNRIPSRPGSSTLSLRSRFPPPRFLFCLFFLFVSIPRILRSSIFDSFWFTCSSTKISKCSRANCSMTTPCDSIIKNVSMYPKSKKLNYRYTKADGTDTIALNTPKTNLSLSLVSGVSMDIVPIRRVTQKNKAGRQIASTTMRPIFQSFSSFNSVSFVFALICRNTIENMLLQKRAGIQPINVQLLVHYDGSFGNDPFLKTCLQSHLSPWSEFLHMTSLSNVTAAKIITRLISIQRQKHTDRM